MKVAVLIPAYNPPPSLPGYVQRLAVTDLRAVVVVNDGSAAEYDHLFRELALMGKVRVLRHATNQGKGAALKTGLRYIHESCGDIVGVVTADADGQHLADDVLNVASTLCDRPEDLVMGVRVFDGTVPLRSRVGNRATRYLFRLLIGGQLRDTQSGLRGIPRDFVPWLLKSRADRYDFELEMLLACTTEGRSVTEREIATVYLDNNMSSHFLPFRDSLKVCTLFFRFIFRQSMGFWR